ncbi:DNA mismatch repair endonuclease MutL [Botrimarina hoheduenensis]|uniref:DNA mismatch repair protein MutL n=1 Tax=Botrimarina hoheduenensis TaxID=2528000 RepID=A0A5C5WEY4_9BACT|nr:DNA mismatch repair endonuclease MutL [Botrimarina hoheduenensis]TWT48312.1 DNA mismatch repair protein MutL [Botrimarina hoheduenensis]
MPAIKPLPPLVVNQIAAGEVVERPASVVKELLENAIDSGATRIDVLLEKGGVERVRVVDNGTGIDADDLPLAIANHATSKITAAEQLFEVGTLGFRGEALASIASVSRLTIRSRARGAAEGAELTVCGAAEAVAAPAGCPEGTTVEVDDLFFNTPVRHKFLRSAQTEAGHATEAFTRVALAHPGVHFTLTHNGRLIHELPPCPAAADATLEPRLAGWRQRIATLFSDDLAAALVAVSSRDERPDGTAITLEGFVANPSQSRSHARLQYLLVNGRSIRDRSLQHALGEAYRGLLLSGRKPICFLRLDMPAALIDVNVHPQKQEVRFAEAGALYSQLLGTLRTKFLSTDLRAGAQTDRSAADDAADGGETGALVAWARQGLSQRRLDEAAPAAGEHFRAASSASPTTERPLEAFRPFPGDHTPLTLHRFAGPRPSTGNAASLPNAPLPDRPGTETTLSTSNTAEHASDDNSAPPAGAAATLPGGRAMQLHDRYLIVETALGMEVIDQHALHERVLYEKLRRRALDGPLEKQRLVVPEPVDLSPAEAAAALEHRPLLAKLGMEIEPFGGDTVLVTTLPALLRRATPAETLREIAAQLVAGGAPGARDVFDELLHSMSCKAAVKYGDPLTPAEIDALLAARVDTENHHHCPHGRPTSLVFTRQELDRRFGRT